ncbi:MAG: hypothetical protein LCH73_06875 [Proteobacteria bacterium]|nr:hypothetical protein [Pseudomonadota bacterium]
MLKQPPMLESLSQTVSGAVKPAADAVFRAAQARGVLWANHVLKSAPAATQRLVPHAGRVLRVELEGAWNQPGPTVLAITPAGLLEQVDDAHAADLTLHVDASAPLDQAQRLARGEQPRVAIEGDAALAADVSWIIANVRWDVAADLERVFGPTAADVLVRAGGMAAEGARMAADGMRAVAAAFKR